MGMTTKETIRAYLLSEAERAVNEIRSDNGLPYIRGTGWAAEMLDTAASPDDLLDLLAEKALEGK